MLVVALVTLAMSSCNQNGNVSEKIQQSSVAFDTYHKGATFTLIGSGKDMGQDIDQTFFDSVSLVLPTHIYGADLSELRDSITSYALGQVGVNELTPAINMALKNMADSLGYKTRLTTSPIDIADGFANINGYVVYLSPDMLVYCVSSEYYTPGAAHGMMYKRYINYMLNADNKGQILKLSDIFSAEGLAQLPDLIAERAQDLFDIIGPTSIQGLPEDGNFFISSEGQIVFAYQPYEIASYAQGFINVAFETNELVDLMTNQGISLFGLEDLNN